MSKLVIVESPAKAKTIQKYLGKGYDVIASMGHVRDLPENRLSVDVKKHFQPKYTVIKGKEKLVEELEKMADKSEAVFLATDPDREGEAISWHLAYLLKLDPEDQNRVTFNEITKTGVTNGMAHPRGIDIDLVNAQQARRILDRLVGYKLSPFPVAESPTRPVGGPRPERSCPHHRRPREGDRSLQARGILERGRDSGCGPEELYGPSGLRRQGKKAPAAL